MTSTKVLVLNGSPKGERSNTMNITRAFLKGLPGDWQKNVVNLSEKKIHHCMGCFGCWNKTPGKCVINDDMQDIYKMINESDVIIHSFPLHFFGMPALSKTATDRCLPYLLPWLSESPENIDSFAGLRDMSMLNKKLVVIATCGYVKSEPMFKAVREQFNLICEGKPYSAILAPEGEIFVTGKGERQQSAYLADVEKAGREFVENGVLSEETEHKLAQPMLSPIGFRTITAAHWAETINENNA